MNLLHKVTSVRLYLSLNVAHELTIPKLLFLIRFTPKLYTSVPQVLLTQHKVYVTCCGIVLQCTWVLCCGVQCCMLCYALDSHCNPYTPRTKVVGHQSS